MNSSNLPHKIFERKYLTQGYDCIIGVDEVGMGCLAGPVVVCAVVFSAPFFDSPHRELRGIRDSKLLTASRREYFAGVLKKEIHLTSVLVTVPPRDVDAYNVLKASQRGMAMAVTRLMRRSGAKRPLILVDGNRLIPGIPWLQRTIIGGDRAVFTIACASVLAKAHRDAAMARAAQQYPDYGFEMHKGYGTQMHYRCLHRFGPSPIHRRSFRLSPAE